MATSCTWCRALTALVIAALVFPSAPVSALEHVPAKAPPVRDVELAYGGLLVGRLTDANGRPVVNAPVSVLSAGKPLAAMHTDGEGVFAVAKLRGGVHEIATADAVQVCRLWAPGTAPPGAPKSIDVVASGDVVRGQYGPPPGNRLLCKAKEWATNPFIVGGVVAAAVAIPVALSDDDGPHS
ncbi:MAG: carboxypeptidase-like regulatory domain-containing protein [Pirellulales bacterium]